MTPPRLSFAHLVRLSDAVGLFEHAELTRRRVEHGYCVDDVARGLVVTAREPDPEPQTAALSRTYLTFLARAQDPAGGVRNRLGVGGTWQDGPTVEDCWGRALWGFGTAAARAPGLEDEALALFEVSAGRRSSHTRAMAFAALGAAEVLAVHPGHGAACDLLADAARLIGSPSPDPSWRWPEPRLRYANGALPEALLAAGSVLDEPLWLSDGLTMLHWLLDVETDGDHLSLTPAGGWSLGEPRPGFDQQPIEVAALADACARAHDVTGEPAWGEALRRCEAWFDGANDIGIPLVDADSGGGCDGLEAAGRNENQGAESTLALLAVRQLGRRVLVAAP